MWFLFPKIPFRRLSSQEGQDASISQSTCSYLLQRLCSGWIWLRDGDNLLSVSPHLVALPWAGYCCQYCGSDIYTTSHAVGISKLREASWKDLKVLLLYLPSTQLLKRRWHLENSMPYLSSSCIYPHLQKDVPGILYIF